VICGRAGWQEYAPCHTPLIPLVVMVHAHAMAPRGGKQQCAIRGCQGRDDNVHFASTFHHHQFQSSCCPFGKLIVAVPVQSALTVYVPVWPSTKSGADGTPLSTVKSACERPPLPSKCVRAKPSRGIKGPGAYPSWPVIVEP
jgi:hypothetical protein